MVGGGMRPRDSRRRWRVGLLVLALVPAGVRVLAAQQAAGAPVQGRGGHILRDRGFALATGRTLPKDAGYTTAYGTLAVTTAFTYGVTDRLTLATGTPLLALAGGAIPLFVSLKYAVVDRPTTGVAVGVFSVGAAGGDESAFTAWPYVAGTLEGEHASVHTTMGLGRVWGSTSWFPLDGVTFQSAAMLEVDRGAYAVFEMAGFGGIPGPLMALGMRLVNGKSGFDFGLVAVPGVSVPVPWVSLAVGF